MTEQQGRHLSLDSFRHYLDQGVPLAHPIAGTPKMLLFIDPDGPAVGVRVLAAPGELAKPTSLERVVTRTVHRPEGRALEVVVHSRPLFVDAYPFLCGVVDRVQLQGMTVDQAVSDTARVLGHLLRTEDGLTHEREIGLLGELLVIDRLLIHIEAGPLLAAWRGFEPEEHDFGFADIDVEVKTTSTEARTHWISSLTQLVPTGDRPLWLLSFQVTPGGASGVALGELVDRIRERLSPAHHGDLFMKRLREAGWRDTYASTNQRRWRLRTPPAAYAVGDGFPRLTPTLIERESLSQQDIPEVRYRINLIDRPGELPPAVLRPAFPTTEATHE